MEIFLYLFGTVAIWVAWYYVYYVAAVVLTRVFDFSNALEDRLIIWWRKRHA